MKHVTKPLSKLAIFDGLICFLLIWLLFYLVHASTEASEEAVRKYGYNIDSGALTLWLAKNYVAPMAMLFGVSSLVLFKKWKHGKVLHWFVVALVIVPVSYVFVLILVDEIGA